jgi:pyruvate,water dikinase
LGDAIAAVLAVPHTDIEEKSRQIRSLWRSLLLPERLKRELEDAYDKLARVEPVSPQASLNTDPPYVAIRSSTREEDAEAAARAGEFDTFLFVHGTQAVLEHVCKAWAGLWTARAIQNRALFAANSTETGGGVIVQRMVDSRVSGVLHTVNMVTGEPNEIVINAGLGLGEGVVSGVVPADHIVVDKHGVLEGLPLRFRYTTVDKRERVVFDARTGLGTQCVETLYHQRLRASLEYVELLELVRTALRLEVAYGYPLDIEFGIEGTKLWILQARPVPTCMTVLQETLKHWPLAPAIVSRSDGRRVEVQR